MRRNQIICCLLLCMSAAWFPLFAQQEKPEGSHREREAGEDAMQEMMAAYMKYAAPGQYHEYLKPMAGKWNVSFRFRMSPDAAWTEDQSKAESNWILGGRFLQQKVSGEATESMPAFEGLGLLGYDNYKGEYVSMWIDTMATMMIISKGRCDPAGKVITFKGTYGDPLTQSDKESKWVYRIQSDDRYVLEMYDKDPEGKEFLSGELTFDRRPRQ